MQATRSKAVTLALAVLAISLPGCIPLPTWDSIPAPELAPHLPADIQSSDDEVLVLTQHSTLKRQGSAFGYSPWERASTVGVRFQKGRTLQNLNKDVPFYSSEGADIVWGIPYGGGGVKPVMLSSETLGTLCILTLDGREIRLQPERAAWTIGPIMRMHANRRDAVVSALRTASADPFARIDGPCGVAGKVEWPTETRTRTIEFLSRLPRIEPAHENVRTVDFVRRAQASDAVGQYGSAVILGIALWRDQELISPPLFLDDSAFEEFRNMTTEAKERDYVAFFTAHGAGYLSGTRALESLKVKSLCAIGSKGENIAFLDDGNEKKREIRLASGNWKRASIAAVIGEVPTSTAYCVPVKPKSWSSAELQRVFTFVTAIPAGPAPASPANGTRGEFVNCAVGGQRAWTYQHECD